MATAEISAIGVATSVSSLVGTPVLDASGKSCGRVHEFAVDVARDANHVGALILRGGS